MTQMIQKSRSTQYDLAKLNALSELLVEDLESLLDRLGLEFHDGRNMFYGCCPVHGGDRFNALNLYKRGYWACRTRQCETVFKKSILGFIRGVLSHNRYGWEKAGDRTVSFQEALDWSLNFLQKNLDNVEVDRDAFEKHQFIRQNAIISKQKPVNKNAIKRSKIRASLDIPSPYYLARGYSRDILDQYDIGECKDTSKEMRYRVVVPIYDELGSYVGCTGRSIFEKCEKCHLYHHKNSECPAKEKAVLYAKWRHAGFNSGEHLYNFSNAKEYIEKTSSVVLVESPGNVWRLVESGIKNCVACFGAVLKEPQKSILDGSGALNIIVVCDNDEAGSKLLDSVKELCGRTYRIYGIKPTKNDVGDMTQDEVTEELKPLIDDIKGVI